MDRIRRPKAALAVSLALLASACQGDTEELITPNVSAKHDATDYVARYGELAFEADRAGDFTKPLEFHGYAFNAQSGGAATVEITQLGSSRGLDTTLFVFGPQRVGGGFGDAEIAFDDDDGYGKLSKVALNLEEEGTYLAVVGTKSGKGRGHYRITLHCDTEPCAVEEPAQVQWPDAVMQFALVEIDAE